MVNNKTFNDVKLNMTLKVQNTRANLSSSKEDMAVQMGKIQKWYTDFTPLVFSKKKVDGVTFDQDIIHYATCSTAASTTSKTVTCTGFNLVTGAWILVRFTVTNTGAVGNLTLNVNGTGAKNIKYRNADLSSAGVLAANRTYMFVYDGTYYQLIGDLDTNADHITTATTSGSGNAVTAITADANGALTVTKGATFLTAHPTITKQTDTTSAVSPTHGGTFTVVDTVTRDTNGHVTKVNTKTVTLPSDKDTITTVSTTGSGNAITAISASNGALTATKGSTFSLSTHTHDSLVSKTLTAETLDDTSGNFFFKGYDLLGNIYDWVGIQADAGYDKFQLIANDNILMFRQNDGTKVEDWKDWVGLLTPVDVTGNNGITVTQMSDNIGTDDAALQYTRGVKIQHTNSVAAETTFDKSRFKYDAQGHVTSSSHWVHRAIGTTGAAGWIKIATMVHTGAYDNTPIMLTIAQRGNIPIYRLHIRFKNPNSTDPDIESFFLAGDVFNLTKKPSAYIIKSATSTWDLYIQKLDNYDDLVITGFDVGAYFTSRMTWTWKNEQVDESAITGGTEATLYDYSRIDHTHSEYIPMTGSSDVTGNLEITKSSGPVGFYAKRSDTNVRVYFGVGDGGTAEGIYSYTSGGWVFRHDGGNTYIPRISGKSITIGGITVPTSSGSFLVTGNTSYTATTTSSTSGSYTIGTLKIGGTDTTIYGKDTVYTHPSNFTAKTTAGFYKYTVNANGHVTAGAALAKSDITALGISASDHTHSNYLGAATTSSSYYGMADPDGTDSNWIRTTSQGIIPYESGSLGSGHQNLGTSTWYFANSYIDNMHSGFINIAGTLPQLKFQQTTSGSEYSDTNAGIKCYPSNTNGMNMLIQSGGGMIIGSGEFPINFYNATKFTAEGYADTNEQIYIGSDNNVYVITAGNTIANRKVFAFGSNFNLAIGGKVVFRYGTTYDSITNHSLTSAATTTSRTWTLPDKTGTIALTSDITDENVTQSSASNNYYRPLLMGYNTSTTAGDSALQTTVTNHAYTNASIYANPSTGTIYANKFNGYPLVVGSVTMDSWGGIPVINGSDGVMEIGKYLDFHIADGSTVNYDVRLQADTSQLLFKTNQSSTGSNISPSTTNAFDLGTSSLKWRNIHANLLHGQAYWLRHCYCLDETSDFANYAWHKVASTKITTTYIDRFITFLVKEKYSASYSNAGILRCRIRTNGSKVKEHLSLTWDYLTSGSMPSDGTAFTGNPFNTANFVAVWTNTASTSCEVEIWAKLINRYSCITFTVLDESRRNDDVFYKDWTLYNSAGHGSSIYTTGTGHIASSACELFGMVSHRELNTTLGDYVKQDSKSEDSWHSLTTTGFTSSDIEYRKYGSVVELTGNFRYTGATSAFSNFATLPSGYRPKLQRQLVFPVCPVGGSGAAAPNAMLRIATDGKMSLLSNNSSTFNNNTWIFNIMFII